MNETSLSADVLVFVMFRIASHVPLGKQLLDGYTVTALNVGATIEPN